MTDPKNLRIVYMGTPEFAVMPLKALVESGYNVVCVVTSVDKPAGRGLKIHESAVKQYALKAGIPILQPERLRDTAFLKDLSAFAPDLGIVIAFRMLPEAVWRMPRMGTFNLHASLLPQYRGAAPINWAIINGETKTGVSTFFLNDRIDEGDIIARKEVEIGETEDVSSLHDRLMVAGTKLALDTVKMIAAGDYSPRKQPVTEKDLKQAPKLNKEICRIDWGDTCDNIFNKIRGLSPYPAAWSELLSGKEILPVKIFRSKKEPAGHDHLAGRVLSDGKTFFKVACKDGYIYITDLQLAGKKRMPVEDVLRGFKITEGLAFK